VITHYQRLLDHLTPDVVHILVDGKIVEVWNAREAAGLWQQSPLG
jgi:Fe-S cluster assembly ATPase SufC